MGLTLTEQETIILWDEEGPDATVYTASPKVKARLLKMGLTPVREQDESSWFKVPRKAIRLKTGKEAVYIAGGQY